MKNSFFVHPTSVVDKKVKIGINSKIWHWCHISQGSSLGKNCILGQNVFIGENVRIGNNVKIQNNVSVYTGVTIKDDVFVGPSVVFTNVKFPRSKLNQKKNFLKTKICKGSTIGANSTIVCGIEIGEGSFVGAGSVVTKNIKKNMIVYGNPASQKSIIRKK
jgi:UDP-2-acetamido-3-amino-2,3-dideoxy-glucuronate N-acetyltransferase